MRRASLSPRVLVSGLGGRAAGTPWAAGCHVVELGDTVEQLAHVGAYLIEVSQQWDHLVVTASASCGSRSRRVTS